MLTSDQLREFQELSERLEAAPRNALPPALQEVLDKTKGFLVSPKGVLGRTLLPGGPTDEKGLHQDVTSVIVRYTAVDDLGRLLASHRSKLDEAQMAPVLALTKDSTTIAIQEVFHQLQKQLKITEG